MSTIDENWNIVDVTRAFCQKVLPLVYDESLSYLEMVCKMSGKLNEVIENNNNLPQYVKDLIKETVNSDEFAQIVGSVLMNTIINVKFPPEGITPAKGDGVTDDTKSIQDCLDYANAQGGAVVFFPSGNYLTSTLSIAGKTSILGADRYNTTLFLKGGGSTPLLQGVINQSVRNIAFDGNRLNQIEENYLIDGDIENALIDNVIFEDSAHCITSEKCNANEFSNVKVLDIGDSVFIDAIGSGNLLSNINTSYFIRITGDNNNWQSPQQTKIDSVEPLEYQEPQKLNDYFNYVTMKQNGEEYKVLVEGSNVLSLQKEVFGPETNLTQYFNYIAVKDGNTEYKVLTPTSQINEIGSEFNSSGSAFDIYVAGSTGSDIDGDGSNSKPFKTIQKALIYAGQRSSFVEIYITESGTYTVESYKISFGDLHINVQATNVTINWGLDGNIRHKAIYNTYMHIIGYEDNTTVVYIKGTIAGGMYIEGGKGQFENVTIDSDLPEYFGLIGCPCVFNHCTFKTKLRISGSNVEINDCTLAPRALNTSSNYGINIYNGSVVDFYTKFTFVEPSDLTGMTEILHVTSSVVFFRCALTANNESSVKAINCSTAIVNASNSRINNWFNVHGLTTIQYSVVQGTYYENATGIPQS